MKKSLRRIGLVSSMVQGADRMHRGSQATRHAEAPLPRVGDADAPESELLQAEQGAQADRPGARLAFADKRLIEAAYSIPAAREGARTLLAQPDRATAIVRGSSGPPPARSVAQSVAPRKKARSAPPRR
jgi:hypothetical protein